MFAFIIVCVYGYFHVRVVDKSMQIIPEKQYWFQLVTSSAFSSFSQLSRVN